MSNDETKGQRPTGDAADETTEVFPDAASTAPAEMPNMAPQESGAMPRPRRLPARFSTILWGMIVLAFAVAVGAFRNADAIPDPITWITGALIVGGLALVVIGIAAAARRAG